MAPRTSMAPPPATARVTRVVAPSQSARPSPVVSQRVAAPRRTAGAAALDSQPKRRKAECLADIIRDIEKDRIEFADSASSSSEEEEKAPPGQRCRTVPRRVTNRLQRWLEQTLDPEVSHLTIGERESITQPTLNQYVVELRAFSKPAQVATFQEIPAAQLDGFSFGVSSGCCWMGFTRRGGRSCWPVCC